MLPAFHGLSRTAREGKPSPLIKGAPFPPAGSPVEPVQAQCFKASKAVLSPAKAGSSHATWIEAKPPLRGARFRGGMSCRAKAALASRSRPRPYHESVVAVFRHLPPEVGVVAEGLHRFQHLLEVRINGGGFGVYFVGRLQRCLHY